MFLGFSLGSAFNYSTVLNVKDCRTVRGRGGGGGRHLNDHEKGLVMVGAGWIMKDSLRKQGVFFCVFSMVHWCVPWHQVLWYTSVVHSTVHQVHVHGTWYSWGHQSNSLGAEVFRQRFLTFDLWRPKIQVNSKHSWITSRHLQNVKATTRWLHLFTTSKKITLTLTT